MATIICVVGDKGGTGKSTWARGLADLYRHTQRPAALFDGDWLSRSLFKFFRGSDEQGRPLSLDRQDPRRGCILYDARNRQFGRDLLLNSMAMPGIDVIVHDLPAGFRTDIAGLMGVSNPTEAVKEFVASARSMGHELVLVNVMTPSPSDYHTAPWLAETVGRSATVIAVRNGLFDSGAYVSWQREAAKGFAAAGGIEIEMPRLDAAAAVLFDQRMLRFTTAVRDERVPLADRMRVLSWLRRFAESVTPVADRLCLPADVAARIAAMRVETPVEPPDLSAAAAAVQRERAGERRDDQPEERADGRDMAPPEPAPAPAPAPVPPVIPSVVSLATAKPVPPVVLPTPAPAPTPVPAPAAPEAAAAASPTGPIGADGVPATPPARPRSPPGRRSLSGLFQNGARGNGKLTAGRNGTASDDGFLLPADTPIV